MNRCWFRTTAAATRGLVASSLDTEELENLSHRGRIREDPHNQRSKTLGKLSSLRGTGITSMHLAGSSRRARTQRSKITSPGCSVDCRLDFVSLQRSSFCVVQPWGRQYPSSGLRWRVVGRGKEKRIEESGLIHEWSANICLQRMQKMKRTTACGARYECVEWRVWPTHSLGGGDERDMPWVIFWLPYVIYEDGTTVGLKCEHRIHESFGRRELEGDSTK